MFWRTESKSKVTNSFENAYCFLAADLSLVNASSYENLWKAKRPV